MYGGVGVGKTMLMDLLVKAAPAEFKARPCPCCLPANDHHLRLLDATVVMPTLCEPVRSQASRHACQAARMIPHHTQLLFNPRRRAGYDMTGSLSSLALPSSHGTLTAAPHSADQAPQALMRLYDRS